MVILSENNIINKEYWEQFQFVTQSIGVGLCIISKDYRVLWANKVINEIFGEVEGKICHLTFNQRNLICPNCGVKEILTTGADRATNEQVGKDAEGETIWSQIICAPIRDEAGNTTAVLETVIPITTLKKAEKSLHESEKLLRIIAENYPKSFISIIEKDMTVGFTSGQEFKKQGLDPESFVGLTIEEVFGEKTSFIKSHYEKAFRGEEVSFEVFLNDQYQEYNVVPLFNENGDIDRILSVVRNISDRKHAEQKLVDSEEKYREAYKRASFYQDLFTHDIKNIFQSILLSTDLFSDNDREDYSFLKDHITRGINLIKNVSILSELEGKAPNKISVDCLHVLKEVVENIHKKFVSKKINIEIQNSFEKIELQASELLSVLFDNILHNAVIHNKNSEVEILVRISDFEVANERMLKMEFIDNGIGIHDSMKESVFLREHNVEDIQGIGLGLSLAKRIVEIFNGALKVENKEIDDFSKGSNFILTFPLNDQN